ncbi:hypothetical protein [Aminipila terrae]|uniref:Uncharacterized protein n=1 Tax=Aminipila terrae TaxID=2697030 RepID=A0A6P1MS15_9FIRM|nr:hypothetical protein [Aminipila terrae]QHI73795.1 hypothetical protein Ami3637_16660 [Aminipila terrae]
MGEYNRYSNDNIRPVKFKREIVKVVSVSLFDKWNIPPTKAYVRYQCDYKGIDMSKPLKIHTRKNGTNYVCFNGKRYDIDINSKENEQQIN